MVKGKESYLMSSMVSYLDKGHDGQPHLKGQKRKSFSAKASGNPREMGLERENQNKHLLNDKMTREKKWHIFNQHKDRLSKIRTLTRHTEAMHALNSGPYMNAWCDGFHGHSDVLSIDSVPRYSCWSELSSLLLRCARHAFRWTMVGSTPQSNRSCTRSISPPYTAICRSH